MLLWGIDELRQLVIAFIPLIIGRARFDISLLIAGGVAVVILGVAVLRYLRFTYALTPDGLVIEAGALFRSRRMLPRARIQSIDLVQKLRHQMFGVVEVRVEVIGGRKTEGRLMALTPAEAERVRADLLAREGATQDETAPPVRPLVRLTPGDLFLAGLTGGRVSVFVLLLGFFDELLPDDIEERFDAESLQVPAAIVVAGVIAVFLFVTMIVSLVATIFVFWGFTVTREDDRLVITRGLLEKRRALVPITRIQAFRLHENPLHRMFGLASVSVRVAGYAGEAQEVQESSVLLPVGRRRDAVALIEGLLPVALPVEQVALTPAPPRALRRRLVRAALATAGAIAFTLLSYGPAGWFAALTAVPFGLAAWSGYRALGDAFEQGYVIARSGWFVRTTALVRARNVQLCERVSTPLQRWARLGSLRLRIPKGSVRVIDLDARHADERFAAIVAAMA